MKVLVDTNIVIDALTNRMPFAPLSQKVLLSIAQDKLEGFLTSNTITDIYYLLHKYLHNAVQTKSVISTLFQSLRILSVNEINCINALNSPVKDYEDAILDNVAFENSIDYIITRNIKDFENSQVKAISPNDLISIIEKISEY